MKNALRISAMILMSVMLLFAVGIFIPKAFAEDVPTSEEEPTSPPPSSTPEETPSTRDPAEVEREIQESKQKEKESIEASVKASVESSIADSVAEEERKKASESESARQSSIEESSSIRASQEESIRESESVEQSVKASVEESRSVAISESESASVAEAIRTIDAAGGFKVRVHLANVAVPDGFMLAKDSTTFGQETEAFYSTNYRIYVFYAAKDELFSYYVYDRLHQTLFPYVTLSDPDGNQLIVSVPSSQSELVGTYKNDVNIAFSGGNGQTMTVPGWIVYDRNKDEAALLYLVDRQGQGGFYVYDDKNGSITLLSWDEYEKKLDEADAEKTASEEESTEATEASVTEETETEATQSEEDLRKGFLADYLIWIIIIAVIIVLVIIAIVVVFFMSKQQEAEESAVDFNEADGSENGRKAYGSSYSNTHYPDPDPFDYDFENAFPDEMDVSKEDGADGSDDTIDTTYETVIFSEDEENFLRHRSGERTPAGTNRRKVRDAFADSLDEDDFEVIDFDSKKTR